MSEVTIDWAAEATGLANHWGDHLHAPAFADAMEQHRDEVCDYTPGFAEQNAQVSTRDFRESVLGAGRIWRRGRTSKSTARPCRPTEAG